MSKELGYKQVKNVESRRTWDRDYYEAKAKERIEKGDDYQDRDDGPSRRSNKEEFQPATPGAAGPAGSARAYLKVQQSRQCKLSVRVVTSVDNAPPSSDCYFCVVWLF